jgi:hypothetical protein
LANIRMQAIPQGSSMLLSSKRLHSSNSRGIAKLRQTSLLPT